MTEEELSTEVFVARVNDLSRKLEEVIHQSGNVLGEVYTVLINLLITRFTEDDDPDRVYRIFTMMLATEFNELMGDLEDGKYDDPDDDGDT